MKKKFKSEGFWAVRSWRGSRWGTGGSSSTLAGEEASTLAGERNCLLLRLITSCWLHKGCAQRVRTHCSVGSQWAQVTLPEQAPRTLLSSFESIRGHILSRGHRGIPFITQSKGKGKARSVSPYHTRHPSYCFGFTTFLAGSTTVSPIRRQCHLFDTVVDHLKAHHLPLTTFRSP